MVHSTYIETGSYIFRNENIPFNKVTNCAADDLFQFHSEIVLNLKNDCKPEFLKRNSLKK